MRPRRRVVGLRYVRGPGRIPFRQYLQKVVSGVDNTFGKTVYIDPTLAIFQDFKTVSIVQQILQVPAVQFVKGECNLYCVTIVVVVVVVVQHFEQIVCQQTLQSLHGVCFAAARLTVTKYCSTTTLLTCKLQKRHGSAMVYI